MVALKVVVVGGESEGKTELSKRIVNGNNYKFSGKYNATVGMDFYLMTSFDGLNKPQMWDASGRESSRQLVDSILRGSLICLYCIDAAAKKNIGLRKKIDEDIAEYRLNLPANAKMLVVVTKSDSLEAGKQKEIEGELSGLENVFFTSAKTGVGVEALEGTINGIIKPELKVLQKNQEIQLQQALREKQEQQQKELASTASFRLKCYIGVGVVAGLGLLALACVLTPPVGIISVGLTVGFALAALSGAAGVTALGLTGFFGSKASNELDNVRPEPSPQPV